MCTARSAIGLVCILQQHFVNGVLRLARPKRQGVGTHPRPHGAFSAPVVDKRFLNHCQFLCLAVVTDAFASGQARVYADRVEIDADDLYPSASARAQSSIDAISARARRFEPQNPTYRSPNKGRRLSADILRRMSADDKGTPPSRGYSSFTANEGAVDTGTPPNRGYVSRAANEDAVIHAYSDRVEVEVQRLSCTCQGPVARLAYRMFCIRHPGVCHEPVATGGGGSGFIVDGQGFGGVLYSNTALCNPCAIFGKHHTRDPYLQVVEAFDRG